MAHDYKAQNARLTRIYARIDELREQCDRLDCGSDASARIRSEIARLGDEVSSMPDAPKNGIDAKTGKPIAFEIFGFSFYW